MVRLGWLFITTLLLYLIARLLQWSPSPGLPPLLAQVATVVHGWGRHAWTTFVGPRGYLVFVTLIAAYVGLHAILEARHERLANRALFERSTFMTMVTSGNRGIFIAAMKMFAFVQKIKVPRDPEPLRPWAWFDNEKPNEDPLLIWAFFFFPLCTAETCGNPEAQPRPWRIDLRQVGLSGTSLVNVDLHDANLYNANLQGADLSDADLRGANLIFARLNGADLYNADLRGADLRGAWLTGADLRSADLRGADLGRPPAKEPGNLFLPRSSRDPSHRTDLTDATLKNARLLGVDLRETFGLTQAQLNTACVSDSTQLPESLIQPAPCLGAIPRP